jgi:hypothetical protein
VTIADFGLRIGDLFEGGSRKSDPSSSLEGGTMPRQACGSRKKERLHFKIFSDRINRMDMIFSRFIEETVNITSA